MSKTFPSVLTVYFFVPVFLFGQYDTGNRYTALSSEKPVTDYFDNVDDKSFYQRQRIHGMKREINDYSERLHNLQSRFDEIFYGLSRGNSFSKPFNTEINPTRPAKKDLYEPRSRQTYESLAPKGSLPQVSVEQGQFYSPPSDSSALFEPQEQNPVNQLAFQVEAPGTYTEDGKTKALFNPSNHSGSGKLGKYFILTPGYAIPYKVHKPSSPPINKQRYRRYDPGVSVTVAGGFEKNDFRFGLGGMYKRHRHHETSYEYNLSYPGTHHRKYFQNHAETFAGFLDLGYETSLWGNLDGYIGLGLGYYLTLVEDPRERKDHGFFATGNIGLAYNFNEMIALRLGYRYLHEKEVPAHVAELGLDFEF